MKKSLPSLAALLVMAASAVVWAQNPPGSATPAAPPAAQPPAEPLGGALLEHAIANLEAVPSLTAKLRHRVDILGRPLVGTGDYAQQGRGPARAFQLHLQLRTSLSATNFDQVSDGQQVWLFEEIDGHRNLSVIDLNRLQRAQPKSGSAPPAPQAWLSLGGLPRLLVKLRESFNFGDVVANKLDDLPVWSVQGDWKRERLIQFLPEQADALRGGAGPDLAPLTPNIPHRVVLHVGQDDLFPYRIEYWRTHVPEGGEPPGEQKLMAVMEWYEVQFGAPVDRARFRYQPPEGMQPVDRTGQWLERLGLEDPPPVEATRRLRSRLQN